MTDDTNCPHGHDRRVTWCAWCEDPSRLTAAAQPGQPPAMMTIGGSSERSAPPTSKEVVAYLDEMFAPGTESLEVRASEWKSVRDEIERLRAAGEAVLAHFMPTFPDSRAVDDCLVGLAAAVSGVRLAHETSGDSEVERLTRERDHFQTLAAVRGRELLKRAELYEMLRRSR